MKRTLILTAFLLIAATSSGQTLSNKQKREMNNAVLDKVEEYQLYSNVDSKSSRYAFIRLFDDPDASIFCDLYNSKSHFLKEMSATEYADFMMKNCESVVSELKGLKKGDVYNEDGAWHYTVDVSKIISYNDPNGILFPIDESRETMFDLEMTFIFKDKDFSQCSIEKIQCKNIKDFENFMAPEFLIVEKNGDKKASEFDDKVTFNKQPLTFNSFHQAYADVAVPHLKNDDIKISQTVLSETDQYKQIQLGYTPKHLRVKVRGAMAIGSPYKFTSETDFSKEESSGYEAGIDFGYAVALGSGAKLGFFTGLGVSLTDVQLETTSMSYSYNTSTPKFNFYTRSYQISSASQGVNFKDLLVPVYASLDFRLASGVSMFFDLGAKIYYNTIPSVDPFRMSGKVSANISSSEITGLGDFDKTYNEFISAVAFNRNSIDISLMGNFGFDIRLYKYLYLEVKGGYEKGLKESYSSSNSTFYSADGNFPYVYSAKLDEDVVVRPLADCISFTREGIWANFGLMIKF